MLFMLILLYSLAKNVLGWRDKSEQEITGADGAPLLSGIQVSFVAPKDVGETG
jgi:hypothetical protein